MAYVICEPAGHPGGADRALVAAQLEFAVPQAIRDLAGVPGRVRERLGADAERLLAAYPYDLAWAAVRAHQDGEGLTRLARGLAVLACRPGGVTFLGITWVAVAVEETGQAAA